jgi:hypothetical protein
MLWYKGWLETRFKLLFGCGFLVFFFVSMSSIGVRGPAGLKAFVATAVICEAMLAIVLPGTGIATQPSFQATKGLHGSMLFTLSLPVSRLRLVAVRAAIGWLELAASIGMLCFGMWFLFPVLRAGSTPKLMLLHLLVQLVGASALYFVALYFVGVFLTTFLDDQLRTYSSMILFATLGWLSKRTPKVDALDILRAIHENSPLLSGAVPWLTVAFSCAVVAIAFIGAVKIAQWREY